MSIKQSEKERLMDYIGHFNCEAVTIPSLQQEVVVSTLMMGMNEGAAFWSYLDRMKLTILTKVPNKANDFIRVEEFDKEVSSKLSEGDSKEKEKEKDRDISRKDRRQDSSDRREHLKGTIIILP